MMLAPLCKACNERHYGRVCPKLYGGEIPPTQIGRQFQTSVAVPAKKAKLQGAAPPITPSRASAAPAIGTKPLAQKPARGTKPRGTKPRGTKPSKGGRPKSATKDGQPWELAGVSRRTWYRQQKAR